ncbi:MAG: phosphatidylserine decarboxylase family protein [Cytophagales bacterium]|nr:phosphatidylserine decarboxylase family protein [Cytophagales bacterium]
MFIHKESVPFLIGTNLILISGIIIWYFTYPTVGILVAILGFLCTVFILQFFRVPQIRYPEGSGIYSPADGKIVQIKETEEDEYFKDKRIVLSIFMSALNAHINRVPMGGEILYFVHHPGKYLLAYHPKSSKLNEHTTMVIKNPNGTVLLLRQIAGYVARRICYYVKKGDLVKVGREFGFIKFGSRVDLYFPLGTRLEVKIGDRVKAGVSLLCDSKLQSLSRNS